MTEMIPELHDIAKLWRITEEVQAALGLETRSAQDEFGNVPSSLGMQEPATATWQGIVGHHGAALGHPSREVFLLMVADHAGSNFSRQVRIPTSAPRVAEHDLYRSVYKLWNPRSQQPLRMIESLDDLRAMITWLANDPDAEAYFERFGHLLEVRPEELRPPLNVTSLMSHSRIVGKIYRYLSHHVESTSAGERESYTLFGKGPVASTRDAEQTWSVFLIKARVGFPQNIVRTRDMHVLSVMERLLDQMASDDRVLVTTFNQILALVSSPEEAKQLLAPLVSEGFVVSWEAAPTPVGELRSTPAVLRAEAIAKVKQEAARIPEQHRTSLLDRRLADIEDQFTRAVLTPPLDDAFPPPICDVCQMERAVREWPLDPDTAGPRENIGKRCLNLRQSASRLYKLDAWTDDPSTIVAWIYVDLDIDRVASFLKPLFQQHARDVGWSNEHAAQLDAQPPLMAEFLQDYQLLLSGFASGLENLIGAGNLERVAGEKPGAVSSLLCARLAGLRQVADILRSYVQAVQDMMPVLLPGRNLLTQAPRVPFRLCIGISGVKFPFSEHWRAMQTADADVSVNVVGRGQLRAPLVSLPALVEVGRPDKRKALHDLVRVAQMSEALAHIYVDDRDASHYGTYQRLVSQIGALGMTYESLLTYAKIVEG